MTLGCGGYGGNITSDNISPRHLLNIKRLAYEVSPVNDGAAAPVRRPGIRRRRRLPCRRRRLGRSRRVSAPRRWRAGSTSSWPRAASRPAAVGIGPDRPGSGDRRRRRRRRRRLADSRRRFRLRGRRARGAQGGPEDRGRRAHDRHPGGARSRRVGTRLRAGRLARRKCSVIAERKTLSVDRSQAGMVPSEPELYPAAAE